MRPAQSPSPVSCSAVEAGADQEIAGFPARSNGAMVPTSLPVVALSVLGILITLPGLLAAGNLTVGAVGWWHCSPPGFSRWSAGGDPEVPG